MKKNLGLFFMVALMATPAMAQKVTIDYAHDFDFDSVKTFQFVDTPDTNAQSSLTDERIKNAIIRELSQELKLVDSDPDLFVTYHVMSEDRKSFTTTNFGYGGWGAGWGGWGYGGMGGMGTSTTQEHNWTEGTLIIDAYDPADKKMVWRGTGTVTVKANPEKQTKQVDNILAKLGKKWDKILAGQGK